MKFKTVLIVVEDIDRSRNFYEKTLGQTVIADFGENVTFAGDFSIHKKSHFQNLISGHTVIQKSNSFELYFEHDDLESVVEKLKTLDIEFVHGIKEQPWKQLVTRFYDYDKNLIEIGESMEHVAYRLHRQGHSIDEIIKITYLGKADIERAIKEYSRNNE